MHVSVSKIENSQLLQNMEKNKLSFKGGYKVSRDLTRKIIAESNPGVRFLMNLGKNNGEILNSIVTAVGTAFVAPIFIAFNPFAKEDKETKMYSAWRQPISAVIALATQIGINLKFNHWLDKLASAGKLDRANLVAKPQVSYLKKIIKTQKVDIPKQDLLAEIEYMQDEAFWKKVNQERVSRKNIPISTEDLIDNNALNEAKTQIKKNYEKQISSMSKKEANKFINSKTMELAKSNVDEAMKIEAANKWHIIRLSKSGKSVKEVVANLQAKVDKLKKRNGSSKAIARFEYMIEKLNNLGDFKYVKKLGNNFQEVLQSVKIKKMVKAGINNAEAVLSSYKKWGGIIISLVTLPFSCGLLNWAYPRLMEIIMPNACKNKMERKLAKSGGKF